MLKAFQKNENRQKGKCSNNCSQQKYKVINKIANMKANDNEVANVCCNLKAGWEVK